MIESVAVQLNFNNPEPLADIRNRLAQLERGFVSGDAPKQPILGIAEAAALIGHIDPAAAKLN